MKKKISVVLVVLIAAFTMFGCREIQNNSDTENPDSSRLSQNETDYIVYINSDETKSQKYNAATKAYNDFLNNEIKAIDISDPEETFSADEAYDPMGPGRITRYSLFDVNKDGIPDLHITSLFYEIFTYKNGQVVRFYTAPSNIMNCQTYALENGAIFTKKVSTGYEYFYETVDSDYTVSQIAFWYTESDEYSSYSFNNKTVSKQEWSNLTKEYFDLSEKRADMKWYEYK